VDHSFLSPVLNLGSHSLRLTALGLLGAWGLPAPCAASRCLLPAGRACNSSGTDVSTGLQTKHSHRQIMCAASARVELHQC
jgi:hypothetical protein